MRATKRKKYLAGSGALIGCHDQGVTVRQMTGFRLETYGMAPQKITPSRMSVETCCSVINSGGGLVVASPHCLLPPKAK